MVTLTRDSHVASRNLPVPLGFVPEGVQEGLFDENTLYLIRHALPEIYQRIFVHLLCYATTDSRSTMQLSLFEKIGEGNHEAIILYQSVAVLAKSPNSPAGQETYHKAILIFETLKILHRTFHRGFTEVRIPLGKRDIRIAALLQSLRALHGDEKRKGYNNVKVKQLARKVAKTLQSDEFVAGIPRSASNEGLDLFEVLFQLLQEHGVADAQIRQTTLTEVCRQITQALQGAKTGRVLGEAGDSTKERIRRAWAKPGDSFHQAGDSLSPKKTSTQSPTAQGTDEKGELPEAESPIIRCTGRKKGRRTLKREELNIIFGEESPESETNPPLEPEVGDSLPSLSISDESSNVITSKEIDTITDTPQKTPSYCDPRSHKEIQREMYEYKNRFDRSGGRQWDGSLINAIKFTTPEIRHLAAIATYYYMVFRLPNGKPVKRPGGLFTNTCKEYRELGAEIPQDIQAWAKTGLTLSEIEVHLKRGFKHPRQLSIQIDAPLPREVFPVEDEGGQYELPMTPHFAVYDCLNRDEANELRFLIEQEREHYPITASVAPGEEDGVFVVITSWDGAEVIHRSEEEWVTYFTDMKEYLAM